MEAAVRKSLPTSDAAPFQVWPPSAAQLRESVWIVIAAYNEETRLGPCLDRVCEHFSNVVVVDDGSHDNTYQAAALYPVWRVRHAVNCGQGAAIQTGIDFALQKGASILVTFDADGQHDPLDVHRLVEPVACGEVDVCLGSRFLGEAPGIPWTRYWLLKGGVWLTQLISRVKVTDTHNGLRALSRDAAQLIRLKQNRMAHASEILDEIQRHRLAYREAPVCVAYTEESLRKGQSSWNALRVLSQWLLGKMLR